MVIGFDETLDARLEHLERTRTLQDECLADGLQGIFSFLPWSYKPYGTALGGNEVSPREYWRHVALSRIFLDNIKHVRTSVLTLNEDAFRALEYGADDFDLPLEDEVTQKAAPPSTWTSSACWRCRARWASRWSTATPSVPPRWRRREDRGAAAGPLRLRAPRAEARAEARPRACADAPAHRGAQLA
jgi:hypothetical protein